MATKPKTTAKKSRASAPVVPAATSVDAARKALVALIDGYLPKVLESAMIVDTDKPKVIRIDWRMAGVKREQRAAKLKELTTKLTKDKQLPIKASFSAAEAGVTSLAYAGHTFKVIIKPAATSGGTAGGGVELTSRLYPADVNVTGKEFSLSQYTSAVTTRLTSHPRDATLNEILRLLFAAAKNKNIHTAQGVPIPLSDALTMGQKATEVITTKVRSKIENEFGEVVGPIMVSSHPAYQGIKNIWFSTSMIEGAYDFKLDTAKKQGLQFSSKAGSSKAPNTLKAKDIIPWFEQKSMTAKSPSAKKLIEQHRTSKEFLVLSALANNNAQDGPMEAIKAAGLQANYKQFLAKRPKDKPQGDTLFNQSTFLEQASTPGNYTWQNKLNFRDLFVFVTSDNVIFIKTHVDVTVREGVKFRCTIFDPGEKVKDTFRPTLRAKPLSAGKATEKIGLTPP